ncbi:immunoglobulin-like domain-containing protein [Gorillibacterium sp. sgz5001074]|uniref:immunoglobulin-like domain-containing protein n=1 Tax=Gorillibacterium sp. sgz5001074 TaxID=3446695 RepID=UPI003F677641
MNNTNLFRSVCRPVSMLAAVAMLASAALGLAPLPAGKAQAAAATPAIPLEADFGVSQGTLIRTEQFNNTNYSPLPVHAVEALDGIGTKVVRDFVKINWYYNKDPNNPERFAYSINTPENLATNPDLLSARKESYDFMSQFTDSILISLAYSYGGDTNPAKNRLLTGETEMNWPEFDAAMKTIIKTLKEKNPKLEYIEVGNEPNLEPAFYGHVKDDIPGYMRMYKGMSEAVVWVNQQLGLGDTPGSRGVRLKVGGPVLSGYNFAKQKEFVDIAYANHYQVDFVSWHRYKTEVKDNETQEREMKTYLRQFYPQAITVVSEYGYKGGGGLDDSTNNVALAKQAAFMTDSAYFYEKGGTDIPMNWVAVHTLNAYFKNQFDVDTATSSGTAGWQTYRTSDPRPLQYLNLRGWRESATSKLMKIKEIRFFDSSETPIPIPNAANDPLIAAVTDNNEATEFLQGDYWNWLKFDMGPNGPAIARVDILWGNTDINKFQLIGTNDRLHYYELLGKTFFTPYFNTMRMFSRLGDQKVQSTGGSTANTGVRMLATKNSDSKVTMMVWNNQMDGTVSSDVSIGVQNLPSGFQGKMMKYKKYLVDETHSNYAYNKIDELELVDEGVRAITGQDRFDATLAKNAVMLFELEAVDASIKNIISAGKASTGTLSGLPALTDGNPATAAVAADGSYPQSVTLDLAREYSLTGMETRWTNAFSTLYRYKIETSLNGTDFTPAADRTQGAQAFGNGLDWFAAKARYVRLTVTGASGSAPLSINEMKVFADGMYKSGFDKPEDRNISAWTMLGYSSTSTPWTFTSDTVTGNTYLHPVSASSSDTSPRFAIFGEALKDYGVEAKVRLADPVYTGDAQLGVLARAPVTSGSTKGYNSHYYFMLERKGGVLKAVLEKRLNGSSTVAAETVLPAGFDLAAWHKLNLECVGTAITGYVDGVKTVEAADDSRTNGLPGLRSHKAMVQYDDVRVYPIMPLLGDIQVNGVTIEGFQPGIGQYMVKLPAAVSTAAVTASVYGTANATVSPSASGQVQLGGVGQLAVYNLAALSSEGNGATYYTLTLRTASDDATLSSLKLSVVPDQGPYNPLVLAPSDIALQPGVYDYTVKVPSRTSYVSVLEAVPTVSNLSTAIATDAVLNGGQGTITVTVTAEAGNTRTYTLHLVTNPEAPVGTVLYQEDFENGTFNQDGATGWKLGAAVDTSNLRVVNDGNGKVLEKFTTPNQAFTVGSGSWTDYEVRARVKPQVDKSLPGVIARASDDGRNFYMLRIHNEVNGLAGGSTGYIALGRVVDGSLKELAVKMPYPYKAGKWYQLRLLVNGTRLMGYVDDKLVFDVTDDGKLFGNYPALTGGKAGIRVANNVARIDDFTVAALTGLPADTVKPVITLAGQPTVTVQKGSTYTDPGATASDDRDGDLTSRIVRTGTVDTGMPGTYLFRYNVRDAAGNAASEVIRTVIVSAPAAGKPFTVSLDGALDRTQGIGVKVRIARTPDTADHDGREAVYFQLLRGHMPVSHVSVAADIGTDGSYAAHFDVEDPQDAGYTVRVIVLDTFSPTEGSLPVPLSEKLTAGGTN